MATKEKVQVPFTKIVEALTETRDWCRESGKDTQARTTFGIDADGDWEFYPCNGSWVEPHGHPDEWGNRTWSLPLCIGEYTNEQVEETAQAWVDGEYREYFPYPPMEVIYDDEEQTEGEQN